MEESLLNFNSINDDYIKIIYENRENSSEEILTEEFKKEIKEVKEEEDIQYEEINESILKNLKDKTMANEIINKLETYKEINACVQGYYNEQYYSVGFKDAIKLIMQCVK